MALVQIARIFDLGEAQVAAAALRASGIAAHLQNEHLAQANPLLQNAVGGFAIWAPEEDAADARAFLRAHRRPPPQPAEDAVSPRRGRSWFAAVLGLLLGT
ncbi:MAG: hypothetical protein JF588_22895 [Caulobacterales bacterium]|nr:hypothetical protein [Caulobacterales bacterium]